MFQVGKSLGAAASVSLLLAACGSAPRPAEELASAKSLVQQADAANAQRYASAELNESRNKLHQAEKADAENKSDLARRSANEAAAEAELASALARSREVERVRAEQQKSLATLREEAQRGVPLTNPDR
jgi:hypothetical protein